MTARPNPETGTYTDTPPFTVGCLCGAVHFATAAHLREVIFCHGRHCRLCRRQTGLYYASTAVPWCALAISGAQSLRWFASSDDAQRGFCGTCGSALFWRPWGRDHVAIMAGAFDDGTPLTPSCHIFTQEKGGCYDITDGLPQVLREAPGVAVDQG